MTNFIIGVGIVFVIVILFMIFRVQSLISVVRDSSQKRAGLSNKVNAALFPIFLVIGGIAMVWSAMEASKDFLPEASSKHGVETDYLFWVTMAVIGFAFILTHILLFFFPFQFQYKENRKASFQFHSTILEVIWTGIPAIVMTGLIIGGLFVWNDITSEAPKNSEVIEIMGKQFAWQVRYPGKEDKILGTHNFKLIDAANEFGIDLRDEHSFDDFVSTTEIHIPKGRPVLLKIRARDVLHSVFIPHMRVKMDAVPGMPTRFWFEATKSTADMRTELGDPGFNYEIACTEICGRGHFGMRLTLVVDEEEDYQKWYAAQKPWLQTNRDYLSKVPENLKEKALKIIGSEDQPTKTESTDKSEKNNVKQDEAKKEDKKVALNNK